MIPPEPRIKGRFNLYDTPDGGFHVAYQEDPSEGNQDPEIKHIDIPGTIVRASEMMAKGTMTPSKALNMFMSLAKNGVPNDIPGNGSDAGIEAGPPSANKRRRH